MPAQRRCQYISVAAVGVPSLGLQQIRQYRVLAFSAMTKAGSLPRAKRSPQ